MAGIIDKIARISCWIMEDQPLCEAAYRNRDREVVVARSEYKQEQAQRGAKKLLNKGRETSFLNKAIELQFQRLHAVLGSMTACDQAKKK